MKAYQIISDIGPEGLQQVELPTPVAGAGEVLIQVRATSLNYRDHMIVSGQYGGTPALPLIPLSDGAGEVVEVGPGVTQWAVGDRVAGCFFQDWERGAYTRPVGGSALGGALDGMLAERVVLRENGLVAIPPHLSFAEAATLPCAALTAWQALVTLGRVAAGQTVLLLGTGGVSTFGLLIAKMNGARVIITSSSDEKLEQAKRLGADEGINYRSTPEWHREVRRLTDGAGADHILEIGGQDTFARSQQSLALHGRLSIIGGVSGFTGELSFIEILGRMATVQGIFVGSRDMFLAMNQAISLHRMKPPIDRVFPFDQTPEAYRHLASGGHFGKIVIAMDA
jgi:NADPH:quinone reductase-like Zn-dependent oxidoreductase